MSRIINNYKIQSTATATTTTTTSTATTSGTSRGASAGRHRRRRRQGERQQTFAVLSVVVSLSLSVSLSVPLHFALRNGTVRGCKVEGGRGVDVLSCCNIFMAGMEYLNSYNFRIAQRAAMQRGHRSLEALRGECGESRERVVVVGLI